MRSILSCVLLAFLPLAAQGRPYYMSKTEMIEGADIIAVVEVSSVDPPELAVQEGASQMIFKQAATATVEQTLKGTLPTAITFYSFLSGAPQTDFPSGRYLVFLNRDAESLLATNWHLAVRPINRGEVEWYANNKKPFDGGLKPAKLSAVLKEIRLILSRPRPAGRA